MTAGKQSPTVTTSSSVEEWSWSRLDVSRPRWGVEHLSHSEVTQASIDRLRPVDTHVGSEWSLVQEIPILVVDTLDAIWAFERVLNKLHGFSRTPEEAKADLVATMGTHLEFLASLESPGMAPILRLELEFLRAVMRPSGSADH